VTGFRAEALYGVFQGVHGSGKVRSNC
jgi:hypothetical protein